MIPVQDGGVGKGRIAAPPGRWSGPAGGLARNVGKHAGGVVISPAEITDFSPLYCEQGSTTAVTQYDKDDVELVGLVKFDFLGLRTLTIIDWAVQTIDRQRAARGEAPLDMQTIALDDPLSFDLLRACKTTAVFQLESRGMKDLIRRLQPDCFEDVVALMALFRPGPLQSGMVDDFIDRKHGRAKVEYPHPDLAPILKPTYGVILYQEQVMQIAQVLANYTLGGADLLRRAMGKKKPEEMAKQRSIFSQGAEERGVKAETATYIFDLMEKFAGYGFNRSHSAAYALVAYQTAWLKSHYPAAFMAAVLSSDMDKTDKVVVFIEECRKLELTVTPPNINVSDYRFTVDEHGQIVYGLGAIKGVGESAIEGLLMERQQHGLFSDLFDLCRRADGHKVNRRVMESLIRAGACDELGTNRATLMAQLPEALRLAEQNTRNDALGQDDLFGLPTDAVAPPSGATAVDVQPAWNDEERLRGEKETLGLYLTGHPIERYAAELQHFVTGKLIDVTGEGDTSNGSGRRYDRGSARSVTLAGLVVGIRTRNAQRGGRMAFVTLDDRSARLEVRIFSETYEQNRHLLDTDKILVVKGTLAWDDFSDSQRLNVDRLLDIDTARSEYAKGLVLSLESGDFNNGLVKELSTTLAPYRQGTCPIWVNYRRPEMRAEIAFSENWRVKPVETLLQNLRAKLGVDRVRVVY
ncbi:MAG: DNA polymerase III subunit alpha [Candidatus Competibacteraceae bacterium]|nr:DNA polymerase III subunit alpha [Candidatus Competibacteraceae bacterium]